MAAEKPNEAVRLEPGNAQLKYIKVETVTETEATSSIHLTGKVGFNEDVTQRLASPIDGRATRILAKLGDRVKPGQALVELTSPEISRLQADAQKARQDLDLAAKALERTKKLKLDGAVSEKDAAQADVDFRKAKADAARTAAQLRSLSVSASDPAVSAALHAQVGGTVIERNVLLGQEVRADAAQPLFTISELATVWVRADVYEQDLGLVRKGETVRIRVPAYPDRTFDGTIEHIGEVLDPASRTVKVRCLVPNHDQMLKPEMFAKVELNDARQAKAINLPASAILTDSEHTRVFVAGDDHVFRRRIVTIGPQVEDTVRVLSGLKLGEHVVTEGAIFLNRELNSN